MSRLTEQILDEFKDINYAYNDSSKFDTLKRMLNDAVEVVRCKDCKWWTKQKQSLQGRCELMKMYPTGAWFCANGAKMDGEEKKDGN